MSFHTFFHYRNIAIVEKRVFSFRKINCIFSQLLMWVYVRTDFVISTIFCHIFPFDWTKVSLFWCLCSQKCYVIKCFFPYFMDLLFLYTSFYKQPSWNGLKFKQLAKQSLNVKNAKANNFFEPWLKNFTFWMLSLLKLNFSATVSGTTSLCTIVFRACTGNYRKIVNFTYSCLCASSIKMVSVDNIITSNRF